MSEEEIILRLEDIIEIHKYLYCDIEKSNNIYKDIQELMKVLKKQFEIYQNRICELEEVIKELKEKNKELEEHQKQYLDGELITANQGKFFEKIIKENYIHKDKIKEIRDKAEVMDYYTLTDVIDDLSKLIGDYKDE